MAEQNNRKLPDSLIIALITHIFIGWGLLYLVKLAVDHLSHNAYWSILIALLIISPFYLLIAQLVKAYPGLSISQIFSRVFGNLLGTVLVIIFLLHMAYFQTIFLHDSQLMVHTYFLINTPFSLMTGILLAGILYIALSGAAAVGRLAVFMLFLPFLVIWALHLMGLSNVNPLNLQPVFEGSFHDWFLSGIDLLTALLPPMGATLCLPFFKKPETMNKITIYSLGMLIPLFFLNILGIIGTFGPSVIKEFNWPVVEYFRLIDFPFLLLEQTGLFFMIAWYASIFVTIGMGAFFLPNEFHIIFPRIKRKWYTVGYCITLWILINLPIGMVASENFFKHTHKWITFSFLSFILITWLVDRLRLKKSPKI